MFDYLYDQKKIKNWQLLILLLIINEFLLFAVKETLEPGLVIGGFAHMPEKSSDLDTFKNHVQGVYRNALIFLPAIMMLKYILLTLFLQMPFAIQFKELIFSKSFRIIMVASIGQIMAGSVRYLVFVHNNLEPGSGRIQEKIPLGLASLMETESLNHATFFLLNQFNGFEIIWCFLLYKGLQFYQVDDNVNLRLMVPLIWLTLVFFQFLSVLISHQLIEL